MKEQNKIKRIGPDKGGHWEVVEEFVESGVFRPQMLCKGTK